MFSQQSTEVANIILRHLAVKLPLRSALLPIIYRESTALRTYKNLLKSNHFPLCNIHQGTSIQGAACSKALKCCCKLMCIGTLKQPNYSKNIAYKNTFFLCQGNIQKTDYKKSFCITSYISN